MNFKNYIEKETAILTEAGQTINDLINNYRKVFPYSDENKIKIKHFKIEGENTEDMTVQGQVNSEEEPNKSYICTAQFHRDNTELPFKMDDIGKVTCNCNAYRYNLSHPNTKNSAQVAPIPSWASIANKEHNPKKYTGVCKHLFSFLHFLYTKGLIRNK